jgi:hypothetical protein
VLEGAGGMMLLEGTFQAYVNLGRSAGFKLVQRKIKYEVRSGQH